MSHERWLRVVLALGAIGCGGGGGGSSVSAERYAEELDRALCEGWVSCGTMPDLDRCGDSVYSERDARTKTLLAAIEAGTVIYDDAAAADCLEGLRAADCRASSGSESVELDRVCARVFAGTVAQGGACVLAEECASDGDCVISPGCLDACCVGVCEEGQVFPPPVAIDGDCSAGQACVAEAYCEEASRTCQPLTPVATGEACDYEARRCDSPHDYCDVASSTCVREAQVGEACSDAVRCVDYASCDGATCDGFPALGEACDALPCLGDLACEGGTCAAPVDEAACPIGNP